MSDKLSKVQEALEDAHSHSKRSGKWSTVPDVRNFEDSTNLTNLRKLVKQGAASEKVVKGTPTKLFKPTRAGAGVVSGIPGIEDGRTTPGDDDRGKEPGKDRGGRKPFRPRRSKGHGKHHDDKKPRDDKKPDGRRRGKPSDDKPGKPDKNPRDRKDPKPGDTVRNTVGAGITTLLVGSMGSSMGSGGMSVPRGGTISMPSM